MIDDRPVSRQRRSGAEKLLLCLRLGGDSGFVRKSIMNTE
jgi:hypothetical protein